MRRRPSIIPRAAPAITAIDPRRLLETMMLIQQTLTKLHSSNSSGMAQGFEEQLSNAAAHSLAFEDRFAMRKSTTRRLIGRTSGAALAQDGEVEGGGLRRGHRLSSQPWSGQKHDGVPPDLSVDRAWSEYDSDRADRLREDWLACAFGNQAPNRQNSLVSSPAAAAGGLCRSATPTAVSIGAWRCWPRQICWF